MNEHTQKPILSVRIDSEILRRLDVLCEETGLGRAEIVERCLMVGVVDEEEFVKWLKTPAWGALGALLLHPKVLPQILGVFGRAADETQMKGAKQVRAKRAEVKRLNERANPAVR